MRLNVLKERLAQSCPRMIGVFRKGQIIKVRQSIEYTHGGEISISGYFPDKWSAEDWQDFEENCLEKLDGKE